MSTTAAVRDWNFMVLKIAGQGLAEGVQQSLDTVDRAGTAKDAYICMRAEQDGKISDYAATEEHHLAPMPTGVHGMDDKVTPMLSQEAMTGFILNAIKNYPANHYCISFDGHSHDIRHAMGAIRGALETASKALGGKKIDMLIFDSCYLGQIETASEFHHVAGVLVGSEDSVGDARPVEKMARMASMKPTSAAELATFLVHDSKEYTMSAMNLDHVAAVNTRFKALGQQIEAVTDAVDLGRIRHAIEGSQHYFTEGTRAPDPLRNTVDVCDCVSNIVADAVLAQRYPALVAAGRDLVAAIKDGFVFAEKHTRKVDKDAVLDYVDPRRSHGVSAYWPTGPEFMRSEYTHFHESQFDKETDMPNVIAHLTADRSPEYLKESLQRFEAGMRLATRGEALEAAQDARDAKAALKNAHHARHLKRT